MHAIRPDSLVSNIGDNVEFWFGGVDAFVSRLFESCVVLVSNFSKLSHGQNFRALNSLGVMP